ncbi:MAG: DUF87 domain-containing protein [Candidatus Paceibacterota bacterium]
MVEVQPRPASEVEVEPRLTSISFGAKFFGGQAFGFNAKSGIIKTMKITPHMNYFAQTDFRGRKTTFGIKSEDRARHIYIIGKTGMGKSTLIENLAIQDIKNGEGMAIIDPHGKSAEMLLDYVPAERVKDVVYFAPFDLANPIAFNIMEDVGPDYRHLVADGLMATFKKIWQDAWSARMEYILNNTLLALLEYPDATLLGVNRMLSDKVYRQRVVDNITDPSVKSFWVDEFAGYTERFAAEATPAIQNKVGQFTNNPLIRNIIGQPKSSFDLRKLMDEQKIIIINLSKGLVGEQNTQLLGGMLVTKLYLAAMSRANASDAEMRQLPPFYLYVDEFQSFANESFADILSEARKYKLSLTIAHQYIEQMPEEVRAAVFGNVGTTIAFRVGPMDSEIMETIFAPTFTQEDLVNLGFAQIYLTLMINGVGSRPFSAVTLPPIINVESSHKEEIIANSRRTYGHSRAEVEKYIIDWTGEGRKAVGGDKHKSDRPAEQKKREPMNNNHPRPTGQKNFPPVSHRSRPNDFSDNRDMKADSPSPEFHPSTGHSHQTERMEPASSPGPSRPLTKVVSLKDLNRQTEPAKAKQTEGQRHALRDALKDLFGGGQTPDSSAGDQESAGMIKKEAPVAGVAKSSPTGSDSRPGTGPATPTPEEARKQASPDASAREKKEVPEAKLKNILGLEK